jgi:hypothetical protein
MRNIIKIVLLLRMDGGLAGCKQAVTVPSGGDITSHSGKRNCAGGSFCKHNITDSAFTESFTAIARPGYLFSKWGSGAGFFCGDSLGVAVLCHTPF